MFKLFKNKIKGVLSKFSKNVEEESPDVEVSPEEIPEDISDKIREGEGSEYAGLKEKPKEEEKAVKEKEAVKEKKPVEAKEHKVEKEEKEENEKKEEKTELEEATKKEKVEKKAEKKKEEKLSAKLEKETVEEKKIESPKPEQVSSKDLLKEVETKNAAEEPVISKKPGLFKRMFGKKEDIKKVEEPVPEIKEPEQKSVEETVVEKTAEESKELEQKEEPTQKIVETTTKIEEKLKETPKEKPKEDIVEKKVGVEKEKVEETIKEKPAPIEEKKGFFGKIAQSITTKKLTPDKFDELFWDMEVALLENNVAMEVIEKIKNDLKEQIVDKPLPRSRIEEIIALSLHDSIEDLFTIPPIDILSEVKKKKPFVICFVGINGSGKTTTIAKVANYLKKNGLSVVLAAGDTFRAAAIDQLQVHADNLGVKLIKHDYGSDPAAVAFDAVKHAKSLNKDVVLIDTAGRLHSNVNLMDELSKVVRVAKPDLKLFVGESITGNDCVEQAEKFNESVGIDGLVLSKADIDEKGGAALSVSYVTKKPILFLGIGQEYDDLEVFDKEKMLSNVGV